HSPTRRPPRHLCAEPALLLRDPRFLSREALRLPLASLHQLVPEHHPQSPRAPRPRLPQTRLSQALSRTSLADGCAHLRVSRLRQYRRAQPAPRRASTPSPLLRREHARALVRPLALCRDAKDLRWCRAAAAAILSAAACAAGAPHPAVRRSGSRRSSWASSASLFSPTRRLPRSPWSAPTAPPMP